MRESSLDVVHSLFGRDYTLYISFENLVAANQIWIANSLFVTKSGSFSDSGDTFFRAVC